MREQSLRKDASLGKEVVLAASGRVGEVAAGDWAGEKNAVFNALLVGVCDAASADKLQKLLTGLLLCAEDA